MSKNKRKQNRKYRKHFIIPDVQTKHGVPNDHLAAAGKYIVEKRPDVVVCLGDFADMSSLSSYDRGKRSFEGRRYVKDIDAAHRGMDLLLGPIWKARGYSPKLVLTLGNHEDRITRAVDNDAVLEGKIGLEDLGYEEYGWEVHDFLESVKVDGVFYSHYFPSGIMGRPCTTPRKMLSMYHSSCIAGHQQGREVAYAHRGDGRMLTSIIAGSFYQHNEDYLTPMANKCWRGMIGLHEVQDGSFDEMFVSLPYLLRRYK